MAQYKITHTCGHSATHRLFGKGSQREYQIKKRGEDVCPDCAKAAIVERHAAEAVAAKDAAADAGLPTIEDGSPKQNDWAESLRAKALANPKNDVDAALDPYATVINLLVEKGKITVEKAQELLTARRDMALAHRNKLETETRAKWWIDNRSEIKTVDGILYEMREELKALVI